MANYYTDNESYTPALRGEVIDDGHQAITTAEAQMMTSSHQLAHLAIDGRSGLSRAQQTDTALTHAQAHLVASAPVVASLLATATGLVLLGWLLAGGSLGLWISIELVIVGAGSVVALQRSRRAGLEHTPAGVERHEIDARAQVAIHAINRHCEMVEKRWGVRE